MHKYIVSLNDNDSYVKAASYTVEDSREIIRKRFRGADIWRPGYDLSCFNFAEADKQLREREANES
jgi:hypothetical protein